ncbi:MAG: V-type ATP synthase subunit E family protein [Methanoregula sp.]|jgi:V/A-type H+-transporting ATPase subunit E|uniref:V-type ATP synthase subunit E family protein n=1 Tax=Methanoregula sp. TaxID=2052170 RepID=UPI0025FC6D4B|nr:V-type ATP synthase subunit E family protein [Methanoregula sp.]MCK9632297.1 V-type ATP synthase subunit E family protein [Methanoregula sp.]
MGLEAVVEEIREKGRSEAEKIHAESKQNVDQIIAAATRRAEEIKLAAEEELTKQSAHLVSQDVSAANLLVKRELLNTQKALLDQVYETTRKDIAALPESFHREAIKKLLAEAKREIPKGTIFCNARDQAAAKAVIAENPEFAGFRLGEPVNIDGGLLIEGEGAELQIDYSYRTFLAKVWESGLKDASDILFG